MRIHHRRQAVRNHQRGFALGSAGQLVLDGTLRLAVQRRSGFIKNQHGRVFEQGARNRHALLFATRELQAALAHLGGIALGRGRNKAMNARSPGHGLNLRLGGAGAAIGNVVGHGVVEQHRVLRHDANRFAHTGLRDRADVLPGNGNLAALHVIKPVQQSRQRAFAGTRSAHHGHGFACGNLKTHALQNGAFGVVGKLHILKTHRGLALQLQGLGARGVGHLALFVHEGEHAREVGHALLDFAVERAQKVQRNVQLNHEGVDHDKVPQRQLTRHHALRGTPQHGHQGRGNNELLAAIEQA